MGIYIPGMEMPTSCAKCALVKLSPTGESLFCNYTLSTVPWDERPFDCPLIPVPEHGRLIDADELVALVYANIALFDSTPGRPGADQKLVRAWLASMADDINDAPTIIPADKEGEE